jgi:hypothetical protein
MKTIHGRTGFTLVEVLVASVILIISLGGVLSLFFYCFSLNERSREYTIAIAEAQNQLEELPAAGVLTGGTFNFNLSLLSGRGVIYVDDSNPELIRIRIVVSWQSNRDRRTIGEDKNLNGILDAGEDLNNNSELDSPIMFTTFLARRY